ncbi:MAG: hypothetical protein J0M04_05690 [Verrucomicrobia bacterium]|nr:hypothetical protein [Verrucomicrobiota bacterium]
MSNPASRLARLLSESGRFSVHLPGQTSIDVTPDIIALLGGIQTELKPSGEARNLFEPETVGRDLATRVHFP